MIDSETFEVSILYAVGCTYSAVCAEHCGCTAVAEKDLDPVLRLLQTNWARVVSARKAWCLANVCGSSPCLWEGIGKDLFSELKPAAEGWVESGREMGEGWRRQGEQLWGPECAWEVQGDPEGWSVHMQGEPQDEGLCCKAFDLILTAPESHWGEKVRFALLSTISAVEWMGKIDWWKVWANVGRPSSLPFGLYKGRRGCFVRI